IKAITEELREKLKEAGTLPFQAEGESESGWVVLDYGDVVVHVFAPSARTYYALEQLWSAATPVLRIR
ncbi:MAG: ribosome silencing factor, partial [Chloroflexi bacterium]|nr:ribosome silencing factor [Chloroflexota bacterium]